jgi:CDP-diacylglycerol--glycerol-3-phosphate 3-phosphatidyltransferase
MGSSMVSYTRARAEGLGVDCTMGPMQRAERLVLLFVATVAGVALRALDPALLVAVVVIALASNVTAVQRIFYVRKTEKSRTPKEV